MQIQDLNEFYNLSMTLSSIQPNDTTNDLSVNLSQFTEDPTSEVVETERVVN